MFSHSLSLLSVAVLSAGCAAQRVQSPPRAQAAAKAAVAPDSPADPYAGFARLEPGVRFLAAYAPSAPERSLWLYVPEGPPPKGGWPMVLVPPAGSPLITGIEVSEGDRPEHVPYVKAGYVVVSFDLSGAPSDMADSEAIFEAMPVFAQARCGAVDAVAALNYALEAIPDVDRARIFIAGHSSAGTVALQVAAEEPRLRGVAAFAPVTDSAWWIYEQLEMRGLPLTAFFVEHSPSALVDKMTVPVFLFHATADRNVPIAQTRAYVAALEARHIATRYEELPGGSHYESMLEAGIPAAISWMASIAKTDAPPRSVDSPLARADAARRGGDYGAALPLYEQLCASDQWEGCVYAGLLFVNGLGTEKDVAAALPHLERGCRLDLRACNELGRAQRSSGAAEQSVETFRKACEAGAQDACVNLGRAHKFGLGADKDSGAARRLYQTACQAGFADGCYLLALSYDDAEFGPSEPKQVQTHMEQACALGLREACIEVDVERARTGPRDPMRVIDAHDSEIRACGRAHLGPEQAVLDVAVTFASTGRIKTVEVSGPKALHDCVQRVLKKERVEPFKDPEYRVTWQKRIGD